MRHRTGLCLVLTVLLALTYRTTLAAGTIKWQTNFTAAKAVAAKAHKLLLVDFFAEW